MKYIYSVLVEDLGLYGMYRGEGSWITNSFDCYDDAYAEATSLYPNTQTVHRGSLDPEIDSPYYEAFDTKTHHEYMIRIIKSRLFTES